MIIKEINKDENKINMFQIKNRDRSNTRILIKFRIRKNCSKLIKSLAKI